MQRAYVSFLYEIDERTANALLDLLGQLAAKGFDEVYLLISSNGGNGTASISLYNILRGAPFKLITHAVGPIDSGSIALFLAGEQRYACAQSRFFVHPAFYQVGPSGFRLDETTLGECLKGLVDARKSFTAIIEERTTLSAAESEKLLIEADPKDPLYARDNGIVHEIREVTIPAGAPMFAIRPKKGTSEAEINAEIRSIIGRLHIGDRWACETYNDSVPEVAVEETTDIVAFGHCLTPFISAFPWQDGAGFGAKYSNPSTLPEDATGGLAFSPDGTALGVATVAAVTPSNAWAWNNGFGAKYTSPEAGSSSNGWSVAFSPDGQDIAFATGGFPDGAVVYPWNAETGFGAKYADASPFIDSSLGGISFSPDGNNIVVGQSFSLFGFVLAFPWTHGVGFGAKYSNISPALAGACRALAFAPAGNAIAFAHQGSPFVSAYPWAAGFGAKYSNPSTLPASIGRAVTFSPSGADVVVGHEGSPFVAAYPWDAVTGFGAKYSNPATLPGNTGISLAFSPSGEALLVGSANPSVPFVAAYEWTPGVGFGAKYTDTAAVLPDDATSIAFRPRV